MYKISELLVGTKIIACGHCLDLIWFHFMEGNELYCLHCQCLVRVFHEGRMIASSNDVYDPQSTFEGDIDSWDWSDNPGKTLFDEQIRRSLKKVLPLNVISVNILDCMDIILRLDDGYLIEIRVVTLTNNESWRFFNHEKFNTMTYVCSGTESYADGLEL